MKIIAANKRAKFDYDISDRLTAGVVLDGPEVKSVKNGHLSLSGSYVTVKSGELFLINAHISPYKYSSGRLDERRDRKLLVHKQELKRCLSLKDLGLSMVPLAAGIDRGFIKLEIGIGRGRKRHDKRQVIKKRQAERDLARDL